MHRGLSVRFENGGASFRGHVERVDPSVAKSSVRLEVAIDERVPAGVRADQTVTAWIEVETLRNVLYVARPANAAVRSSAEVFRVDAGGAGATRTNVQLGRGSAREIEVLGGLAEGDEIIVRDVVVPEGATRARFK